MSDFKTFSTHEIAHRDGWSFIVEEYDDGAIRIGYREEVENGQKTFSSVEGLWPESARQVAAALISLANQIDVKTDSVPQNSAEFQKGFYAGLAYAQWSDEAINAAADAAKRLAT